jgi:hypothetical protein
MDREGEKRPEPMESSSSSTPSALRPCLESDAMSRGTSRSVLSLGTEQHEWTCFFCKIVQTGPQFEPEWTLKAMIATRGTNNNNDDDDDDDDDGCSGVNDDDSDGGGGGGGFGGDATLQLMMRTTVRFCGCACWVAYTLLKHGEMSFIGRKLLAVPTLLPFHPKSIGGHVLAMYLRGVAQRRDDALRAPVARQPIDLPPCRYESFYIAPPAPVPASHSSWAACEPPGDFMDA